MCFFGYFVKSGPQNGYDSTKNNNYFFYFIYKKTTNRKLMVFEFLFYYITIKEYL